MTERREAVRQPARAPLPRRSRKRWAGAAGIAVGWLVLLAVTGSANTATMLVVVIVGLGLAVVLGGLRALGVTRDHPRIPQMTARPWRDERDQPWRDERDERDEWDVQPGFRFADSGPEFVQAVADRQPGHERAHY